MDGRLAALLSVALLASCGGGASPAPQSTSAPPRPVQGAAVKGPLVGATIRFFHLDAAGNALAPAVATATTDAQGHVSAELPSSSEPLLAVSSGGSYVDEGDDNTPRRRIELAADEAFEALVPANAQTFCLTPYSMALLLRARALANGANFLEVYEAVVTQAQSAFGFDPTTVIPGDPLAPDLSDVPAAQYALLLGGAAYAIDAIAVKLGVQPSYAIVRGFIEDLSDGRLDGQLGGEAVQVKAALPSDVSINDEVLRFRNNHFELYNGLPLPHLDEDLWSQQPPLPGDLPPLARPDAIALAEGGTATALVGGAHSVLANDSDTYGNPLTAVLVDAPEHGTLSFNSDGSFAYVHDGSETTSDDFTYRANNGAHDSAPAQVTIDITPVNDMPVARDDSYVTLEDTPLAVAAPGVLGNDTDGENEPLSAVLQSGPLHGQLALNADGSFTYAPGTHFSGTDHFTYRASDGQANSNIATVTIRVGAVNHAPLARDDTYLAFENSTLSVVAPGVLGNDSDPDGDSLTLVLVTPPGSGTLNLNPNGSFNYTPANGFTGSVSFTYRANDGAATSDVATVRISVRPNDPPVAVDDCYYFFGELGLVVDDPGDGVLNNDSDPDGDPLSASLISLPQYGTLVFHADGTFSYTPTLQYDGDYAYYAYDEFSYRASDGHAVSGVATVYLSPYYVYQDGGNLRSKSSCFRD